MPSKPLPNGLDIHRYLDPWIILPSLLVGNPGPLDYVHVVGLPIWYSPDISTLNASRSPPALDEVEKLKASPLELPAEDIQSVPKINKRQQKDLS